MVYIFLKKLKFFKKNFGMRTHTTMTVGTGLAMSIHIPFFDGFLLHSFVFVHNKAHNNSDQKL